VKIILPKIDKMIFPFLHYKMRPLRSNNGFSSLLFYVDQSPNWSLDLSMDFTVQNVNLCNQNAVGLFTSPLL